ncbi:MAG TPA: ABC transporter ATP-binding protein [Candidatus Thermoplasmatota archaeon]|nr:ABC transporter ATP-binding protein [Candidatus Thermoplasmatota archaeon]
MIEAEGLSKRFGTFTALEGFTLSIGKGEVFGCLGPNGAGKSTATKLLCTLIRPTAGTARVCGFDIVREAPEVRRRIGYLPEKVPVYKPLTAREDLRYFARLHGVPEAGLEERIEASLRRVGLVDVEHRRSGAFSKGMVQRLGIARAILHEPEVVFLDEPASGLDPTGRRGIRTLIQELASSGATVFLCSHDLGEVRAVAHKIGFIRKGKLVQVRSVGAGLEGRLVEMEVEGDLGAAADAVRALAHVGGVEAVDGRLRVRGAAEMDRRELARAVRRAGATLLFLEDKEPSLDQLYAEYIETGEEAPAPMEVGA